MRPLRLIIALVLLAGLLPGQDVPEQSDLRMELGQQAGVILMAGRRAFDGLTTEGGFAALAFDYPLAEWTHASLAVGANRYVIPATSANITDLNGKMSLFGGGEIAYQRWLFYGRAGAQLYRIKGTVTATIDQNTDCRYDNVYLLIDYPLEAGLRLNLGLVEIRGGLLKTYLYGTNKKTATMLYDDRSSGLGTRKYSFIDRLPPAVTAEVRFNFSGRYGIRLNCEDYSGSEYRAGLSLWSSVAQTVRL